ncbi:MAG TPA: DedA family protein [Burkholderiales bacterium]|nr:DedA family protein [Burkholderiales bacterium]
MQDLVTLPALFLSSFLAATLLPGGSEVMLFAVVARDPALLWPALGWATLGNTLGGLTSYLLGRLLPHAETPPAPSRALCWLRRFGSPALLLSWAPVIGDALCVAAGWLRVNALAVLLFLAVGKFLRYWAVSQAALP